MSACQLEILQKRLQRLTDLGVPFPQHAGEFLVLCQQLSNQNAKPSAYLEIGSRHGGSLYAASGFLATGSLIIAVDLPGAAWGIPGSEQKLDVVCGLLESEGYCVNKILADSSSVEAQKGVRDVLCGRYLDAVFIDADHTLSGVTSDWNTYGPLVRTNGIVAFHDILISPDTPNVEVGYLWADLRKTHSYLEVVFQYGIGIIWKR